MFLSLRLLTILPVFCCLSLGNSVNASSLALRVAVLFLPAAEKYNLMPIEIIQGALIVGVGNPLNLWPESELKELTGFADIKTVLCLPDDIRQTIAENYR